MASVDPVLHEMEEEHKEIPHRYKAFGMEWAPLILPIERRLQTFAAFFWINTFVIMGLSTPFFFLYLLLCTQYYYIPLLYLTWYIWDYNTPQKGGRRIQWVREWRLWKYLGAYFPIRLIKTVELDPNRNYVIGCHPHGILCASHFTNFATEASDFSKTFPGLKPFLLTLNLLFCFPFYREFAMCGGMCSVTKESINHLLKEPSGQAVFIVVGGAAESLDAHPGKTTLILKNRKGFVKLALKNGASLVPVFSFGENALYEQVANPKGSSVRWFQDFIRGVVGLAPAMFRGRGIFQYSVGIVPFRRNLVTVVGAPIDVPKIEKPTDEEVSDYHKRYMAALYDLYEEYKPMFEIDPNSHLEFV